MYTNTNNITEYLVFLFENRSIKCWNQLAEYTSIFTQKQQIFVY